MCGAVGGDVAIKGRLRLLLGICLVIAGFSGCRLLLTAWDYHSSAQEYRELREAVFKGAEGQKGQADTEQLETGNKDCIGWIRIDGTKIDYPIMRQTALSPDYLRTGFYGEESISGAIFTKNEAPFIETNTVLFGHNMKDGSMFAGLKKFLNKAYLAEHPQISIFFEREVRQYEIFSVCLFDEGEDALMIEFPSEEEKERYISRMIEASRLQTGNRPGPGAQLLTLSTCYGTSRRLIVQGFWEGGEESDK